MVLKLKSSLLVLLGILTNGLKAYEEVHTLAYKYHNETLHIVADFDADENWITHHVFPTKDLIGITIARDHAMGMEVFRPERIKACYARPITKDTRSVWEFKSMLELEEEHNMEGVLPRKKQVENLECTTNRIPISKLGKVAYLCRDLPIYEIKTRTPLVHAGQRRLQSLPRPSRSRCYICGTCDGVVQSFPSIRYGVAPSLPSLVHILIRAKREPMVESCTRVTYFYNCPPHNE